MIRNFVLLSLMVLHLTACFKTRSELRSEGFEPSRRSMQQKTQIQQQTQVAESGQAKSVVVPADAALNTPVEDLDSQMRQLNGRIDTLENQMAQLIQAQSGKGEESQKSQIEVNQKFAAYEEALKGLEQQVLAMRQELQASRNPAPAAKVMAGGGKSSFDLGESAFANKEWKDAIVNYQKYREENPKGKMYPTATYKIGVSFMELKMKDEARPFLQEVVDKFPKSREAKKAEFRLKSL